MTANEHIAQLMEHFKARTPYDFFGRPAWICGVTVIDEYRHQRYLFTISGAHCPEGQVLQLVSDVEPKGV